MNTKYFILIVVSLMFWGCVSIHSDSRLWITIKGVVYDKTTGIPLDEVSVKFIDTGFDHALSKHPKPFMVGKSDNLGRLDVEFNHYWGWDHGLFKGSPKATFEILLSKDSYTSTHLHFKADDWAEKEGRICIDLKEIYLEPIPKQE